MLNRAHRNVNLICNVLERPSGILTKCITLRILEACDCNIVERERWVKRQQRRLSNSESSSTRGSLSYHLLYKGGGHSRCHSKDIKIAYYEYFFSYLLPTGDSFIITFFTGRCSVYSLYPIRFLLASTGQVLMTVICLYFYGHNIISFYF